MDLRQEARLFVGIEYEGKRHVDFALRPLYVRDSIKVNEQAGDRGPVWVNIALLAAQIERLGDIPREKITPELLEGLLDEDMLVFEGARIALQKKIRSLNADGKKNAPPHKSRKSSGT